MGWMGYTGSTDRVGFTALFPSPSFPHSNYSCQSESQKFCYSNLYLSAFLSFSIWGSVHKIFCFICNDVLRVLSGEAITWMYHSGVSTPLPYILHALTSYHCSNCYPPYKEASLIINCR